MARPTLLQLLARMFTVVAIGAGATASQAAIYYGSFDPLFGGAFGDLGWRGRADFFIPNACNVGVGTVPDGPGCDMSLLAARVDFYRFSATGQPTLATATLVPPPQVPDPVTSRIRDSAGNVFFTTDPIGPSSNVFVSDGSGTLFNGRVSSLIFEVPTCISIPLGNQTVTVCSPQTADLFIQNFLGSVEFPYGPPIESQNRATVQYTLLCNTDSIADYGTAACPTNSSVPEPGVLSLLIASIVGLALFSRRRVLGR